jgi:nucleotide-binding universal stress UspA family protein
MNSIHTILCPIDRSEHGRAALAHAAAFARAFEARLRILQVAEVPPVLPIPENGLLGREGWVTSEAERSAIRTGLEERVAGDRALAEQAPDLVVRTGLPADEIILEALESAADLVVLSTHGRSGLTRFLLGSVAEKVALEAPCPVLTVRPGGQPVPPVPKRILVPTDLSEHSFAALPMACELAERFEAEVSLFAVLEDPLDHPEIEWQERAGIGPEEVKAHCAEKTRDALRGRLASAGLEGRVRRVEIGYGRPARTVVERAEAEGIDLIVLSSHGRSGVARAMLGSTAREIVRHAPRVLTVRPGAG